MCDLTTRRSNPALPHFKVSTEVFFFGFFFFENTDAISVRGGSGVVVAGLGSPSLVASVPVTGATASDGADASAGDAGGCGGVGSAATAAEAGDGELGGTSAVDCSKGAVVEFAVVPGNCGGAA